MIIFEIVSLSGKERTAEGDSYLKCNVIIMSFFQYTKISCEVVFNLVFLEVLVDLNLQLEFHGSFSCQPMIEQCGSTFIPEIRVIIVFAL